MSKKSCITFKTSPLNYYRKADYMSLLSDRNPEGAREGDKPTPAPQLWCKDASSQ